MVMRNLWKPHLTSEDVKQCALLDKTVRSSTFSRMQLALETVEEEGYEMTRKLLETSPQMLKVELKTWRYSETTF